MRPRLSFACRLIVAGLAAAALSASTSLAADQWFKGNTHTHTWWSDGDAPPEMAVKFYREHGYQFLMLSDHNILSDGEKWVAAEGKRTRAVEMYEKTFPAFEIIKRQKDGKTEYRLKTLTELRRMFEKPGEFIMLQGEEISDFYEQMPGRVKMPVHINAVNLEKVVPAQGGRTPTEVMQRNIDAVLAQRRATGRTIFPHVNHPNFKLALTAEDMAPLRGEQFFEVYNGHPGVNNAGTRSRLSTERIWDVVLSRRLGQLNLPVMYGLATDDAHTFTQNEGSCPGRGWVMVRADRLEAEALGKAMERGDFYATSGVLLKSIEFNGNTLSVEVDAQPGVNYRIQFIGTPRDYDRKVTTRPAPDGLVVYEYGSDIGKVFSEQPGPRASYHLQGNELYIRATIVSSAPHPRASVPGDVQKAWVQPVRPK